MSSVTIQELLEAGVHFGHQTKRWNPRMENYIFEARNKIHIIDLRKTRQLLNATLDFIRDTVAGGKSVLFVGTKRQIREIVKETALRLDMFFVIDRWLGGTLTNFQTIRSSVKRLEELENIREAGLEGRSKKEIAALRREEFKLHRNLDGIRQMTELPGALVVIDIQREQNAVLEGRKLGIPLAAIVDTNCDPTQVDFPIPGNDDGIRSAKLIITKIEGAISEGIARRDKQKKVRKKQEKDGSKQAAKKETVPAPSGRRGKAVSEKPAPQIDLEEEASGTDAGNDESRGETEDQLT